MDQHPNTFYSFHHYHQATITSSLDSVNSLLNSNNPTFCSCLLSLLCSQPPMAFLCKVKNPTSEKYNQTKQPQNVPYNVLQGFIYNLLWLLKPHFCFTVSPLHTNLQVTKFQRCQRAFHQCLAWVKLHLALCLLLLMIHQFYHLPSPLPLPVSNSSCLFTQCQPRMPAVVLHYCSFQGAC